MDIEKLIEQLRYLADTPSYTAFHDAKEREIICDQCEADFCYDKQQDAHWCMYEALSRASTALSTLQAENKRLNKIVCSIPTTPDSGRTVSQYDKEMSMCAYLDDLEAENEKLRAELESVRAERNAAVEDVAAIIGDVEEIRRGYGVDNEDADSAFARLCETYCANNGRLCYAECEKYHCKNFKWRGQKED